MLTETLLAVTAREGRALLEAVQAAPSASVACCPGWDNRALLRHVGGVHRFVDRVVSTRASGRPTPEPEDRPPAGDVDPSAWYSEGLVHLLETLREADPAELVWSWTNRRDAGFYHRRMAHETTVHRYDAESAGGTAAPIDPEVAADGVNEIIAVGMRYRGNGSAIEYPESSALLVRSDGSDRWLLRAVDGTLMVARNSDAGDRADVTITGTAEDLYLHLWGRPAPTLRISGDKSEAAAWAAVAP